MQVRVGHWPCHQSMGIEFREADARHLALKGVVRLDVALEDRLLIVSGASGNEGFAISRNDRLQLGFTHLVSAHIDCPGIPFFELTDMELCIEGDGEDSYFCAELPADHELAWPSKRSVVALAKSWSAERLAEFLEDQVQARCNSAVASAARIIPIPAHIRDYCAPGVYQRTLETAKALSGVV